MKIRKAGIIPIITAFMLISATMQAQNVMQELKKHNETTLFAQALENANLDDRLTQAGPFTLFVPSNKAFGDLSNGQKSDSDLLLNHIFMGMATERSLRVMTNITCLSGHTISITKNNSQIWVDSYVISTSNIRADNGVIHIIDGVIE